MATQQPVVVMMMTVVGWAEGRLIQPRHTVRGYQQHGWLSGGRRDGRSNPDTQCVDTDTTTRTRGVGQAALGHGDLEGVGVVRAGVALHRVVGEAEETERLRGLIWSVFVGEGLAESISQEGPVRPRRPSGSFEHRMPRGGEAFLNALTSERPFTLAVCAHTHVGALSQSFFCTYHGCLVLSWGAWACLTPVGTMSDRRSGWEELPSNAPTIKAMRRQAHFL